MNRLLRRAPGQAWSVFAVSLLLSLGLAVDLTPWLRGDLDWRWTYNPPDQFPFWLVAAILILAGYIAAAAVVWRWALAGGYGRRCLALAFTVVMGLALQLVVIAVSDSDPIAQLLYRTSFPYNGGFYGVALNTGGSIPHFLANFPQTAPHYVPHPQRHPPGIIVMFMLARDFFHELPGLAAQVAASLAGYRCDFLPYAGSADDQFATAAVGLLSPVLTALGVVPLYFAACRLAGERVGLGVVLISPLIPAYALWAGVWDQAFVLVTGLVLWLMSVALYQRRLWAWWAAGALLSAATLFSHAMLVLIAFAGCWALIAIWQSHGYWLRSLPRLALGALGFVVALSSVWVVYWLTLGVTFLDVYRANTGPHFHMRTHYAARLFYNPYDFALFLGFPVALLALIALGRIGRDALARRPLTPLHGVGLAFAVTFVALVVSGVARAEVGRVWIFLMPLALLAAFTLEDGPARSTWRWVALAGLLAAQTLVMQVTLELNTPRPVYRIANPLPNVEAANIPFNPDIWLAAYSLQSRRVRPGDRLNARLYWETTPFAGADFKARIYLAPKLEDGTLGPDKTLIATRSVTTCNPASPVQADLPGLLVPPDLQPGQYVIMIAVAPAGASSDVESPPGSIYTLTTIEIRR